MVVREGAFKPSFLFDDETFRRIIGVVDLQSDAGLAMALMGAREAANALRSKPGRRLDSMLVLIDDFLR